jgi:hypothetical protein
MIIAALFALSILWCLVRCACLGKDFACCCFRCFSCCCGPKRQPDEGGFKYGKMASAPPTRSGQYESHAKMDYGSDAFSKTATFEGNVHADSLPPMPSWETAASRKVEIVEKAPVEEVEMEHLKDARSPSLRSGGHSPGPGGPVRSHSGHDGYSSPAPHLGPSRHNSGNNGIPSPMQRNNSGHDNYNDNYNDGYSSPMAPQRNDGYSSPVPPQRNDGYSSPQRNNGYDMPSPMEPSIPNIYGSGNRAPRDETSPVYGGAQDGYSRAPHSGRNTPQAPYSAGGSRDNYGGAPPPRSPGFGPPTNSNYSNANNGFGPPSANSYYNANSGYSSSGGGYSSGNYNSNSADGYSHNAGYDSTAGAGYSSYDAPVASPYSQQSRRPGPGQQQGSYRGY